MQAVVQVQEQTKEPHHTVEQHQQRQPLQTQVAVAREVLLPLITTAHQALSLFVTPILIQLQHQQQDHQQQQHLVGIVITHGQVVGV
jgi:hypothetical protein